MMTLILVIAGTLAIIVIVAGVLIYVMKEDRGY